MSAPSAPEERAAERIELGESPAGSGRGLYAVGLGLVLLAAAGTAALALVKRAHTEGEAHARREELAAGPRVLAVGARPSPPQRSLSLQGDARPFSSVTLYAKLSGYLKEIRVDKGDLVRAGQLIAVIEAPELDRQFEAARSESKNKRVLAQRAAALVQPGVVSTQDADSARTSADSAEASLAALETQRGYAVLRAPFAGRVTARFADPGALVQSAANGQTGALPLVTIAQTQRLRVQVHLNQRDAALVRVGDPAEVSLPDRPEVVVQAKVSRLSGELDARSRTLLAEIECENQDERIVAGSFVRVTLVVSSPIQIELPTAALVLRGDQTLVAVIDAEDRIRYRPVVLSDDDGERLRILSGVSAEERVAVGLGDSLPEGTRVRPVAPRKP